MVALRRARVSACFWFIGFSLGFQPALFGQALHLSLASQQERENLALEVSLQSTSGKEPSALQWEITLPLAKLAFQNEIAAAGQAAQAAGKSVSCAIKPNNGAVQTATCVVYGGQESIRDGVVAVTRLRIPGRAKAGAARITVNHGLAVYRDLRQITLNPVEVVVKIPRQ